MLNTLDGEGNFVHLDNVRLETGSVASFVDKNVCKAAFEKRSRKEGQNCTWNKKGKGKEVDIQLSRAISSIQ